MNKRTVSQIVNDIMQDIKVNISELSAFKNSKISVTDDRTSSKTIGINVGVVVLSVMAALIAVPDLVSFLHWNLSRSAVQYFFQINCSRVW